MCPGLLETRWYVRRGVPAFAYGPGLLSVSHGPHEFVPIRNIPAYALVYALTAVRLLGTSAGTPLAAPDIGRRPRSAPRDPR